VLINAVEHVHDFNAVLAVQVARGLIGKQDRWPVDNSAGNADALLLTTGKFSWLASSLIFKTDHFQCVRHPLANLSPGGTNNFHGESHIVENRTFAQQPEVLEYEPDVTAQFRHTAARDAVQVLTCHIDGTASGALFAQYQTKEGQIGRAHV